MTWSKDNGWTKNADPISYDKYMANPSALATYERTVSNVTFTADEGAVLKGFIASSGHVYSSDNVSQYNYVLDKDIITTSENSYFGVCSLENIRFENLTINGRVQLNNYVQKGEAINSHITFEGCTFDGSNESSLGAENVAIRMKSDSEYFKNITVSNCSIKNYYQGIYIQGPDTVTINNNVIDTTTHNAVALQSSTNNSVQGKIILQENIIKNATDRAIRFGNISDNVNLTVKNNVMLHSGDSDGQLIKPGSIGNNVQYSLENNYWAGKDAATAVSGFNPPSEVGIVGGTFSENVSDYTADGYTLTQNADGSFVVAIDAVATATVNGITTEFSSLAEAVKNADTGTVVTVLKDTTVTSAITSDKNVTIKGIDKNDGTKVKISGKNFFSQTPSNPGAITLENLELELTSEKEWYIYHSAGKLTINNCAFTVNTDPASAGNVIMGEGNPSTDKDYSLVFTNNTITANARAAITGIGNNSVITGNTIDLMDEHWKGDGGQQRTSILALTANKDLGGVTIKDNVFKNANRALAVDNSSLDASDLTYQENQFIDVRYAFELSPTKNADCGQYDLNYNYFFFENKVTAPRVENADSNGDHFADIEEADSTEYKIGQSGASLVDNTVYYEKETMNPEDLNTYVPSVPSDPTPEYNYAVVVNDADNGIVSIEKSDQWANKGEKITITVTPDDGYMLDELMVTDTSGNELDYTDNKDGTYTFTMPASKVNITATFIIDPNYENPSTDVSDIFSDVAANAWYKDVVQYVYDKGFMTGTSSDTFEPDTTTTRGMIVSILHRLEGSPTVTGIDFTDVNYSDWYGQAVAWASSEGIVGGYGDGTFQPNKAITREEMASILYRYAAYKGIDVSARTDLSKYSDANQIATWATEVMQWANAEGLINGMTKATLEPQGNATRAQVAAMMERFLENVIA